LSDLENGKKEPCLRKMKELPGPRQRGMSLPIHVTAYSGYKANERPRDFTVDEDLYEIAEVEDR